MRREDPSSSHGSAIFNNTLNRALKALSAGHPAGAFLKGRWPCFVSGRLKRKRAKNPLPFARSPESRTNLVKTDSWVCSETVRRADGASILAHPLDVPPCDVFHPRPCCRARGFAQYSRSSWHDSQRKVLLHWSSQPHWATLSQRHRETLGRLIGHQDPRKFRFLRSI